MTHIRFVWDEAKNRGKHGLSFEEASHVFFDPLHLSLQDRIENGEQRWQTLGQVDGIAILLVAHTFTEDGPIDSLTDEPIEVVRIISARPATRKERRRYENG